MISRMSIALIALVIGATMSCVEGELLVTAPPSSPPRSVEQTAPQTPFVPALTVTAVVPADAFSLQPRVEIEDSLATPRGADPAGQEKTSVIVLPLPPAREDLRRVDVWLSVTGHEDGRIADRQHAVFTSETRGDALRLYVAPLPGGTYDAEIRAVALVDAVDAEGHMTVEEKEDKTVLSIVSTSKPLSHETTHTLDFHFRVSTAELTAHDRDDLANAIERVRFIVSHGNVSRAQIDCWASSEGQRWINLDLSRRRCAWFQREVWSGAMGGDPKPPLDVAAHGADDPPEPDSVDFDPQKRSAVRAANRVVRLRIFTSD